MLDGAIAVLLINYMSVSVHRFTKKFNISATWPIWVWFIPAINKTIWQSGLTIWYQTMQCIDHKKTFGNSKRNKKNSYDMLADAIDILQYSRQSKGVYFNQTYTCIGKYISVSYLMSYQNSRLSFKWCLSNPYSGRTPQTDTLSPYYVRIKHINIT